MERKEPVDLAKYRQRKNNSTDQQTELSWHRPCVWSQENQIKLCRESCPLWEFSQNFYFWSLTNGIKGPVAKEMWQIYQLNNPGEIFLCAIRKSKP